MQMQQKGLSRDAIKYAAMFTMLLNHIANVFLSPESFLAQIFLDAGYFTAPVMCFFLVEGFYRTHSRRNYAARLAVFSVISELPYCLAFSGAWSEDTILAFCGMNMMFTLLLCFGILEVLHTQRNALVRTALIAGLTVLSLFSDWALLAPCYTLLFAWARGSREREKQVFSIAAVVFAAFSFSGNIGQFSAGLSLLYAFGAAAGVAAAGVVILFAYNGRRAEHGRTFSKWFFYWFYPVHLLLLGVIRVCAIGI